ncbi:MAG: hypothetical protein AAF850_02515 [Pseudomonadota bacterium]
MADDRRDSGPRCDARRDDLSADPGRNFGDELDVMDAPAADPGERPAPPVFPTKSAPSPAFAADGLARLDALASSDRRRRATAISTALLINAFVLIILGIYGRVRIFVPNAPATSISVVFVDNPDEIAPPALDEPEAIEEPEPEAEDDIVEIVEEPVLQDDPTPDPSPDEQEATTEPAPEPEDAASNEPPPILDLLPEPAFAPARENPAEPLIPQPSLDDRGDNANTQSREGADAGDQADDDAAAQSPAPAASPLIDPEPVEIGVDVDADEGVEDGDMAAGEQTARDAAAAVKSDSAVSGDDMFDAPSRFMRPRRALPLPKVDLPAGEEFTPPGESGVVAIFCPEEFNNEDKQKECAGRPEIRSGWRPGQSGEDFAEAARLLRRQREAEGAVNAGRGSDIFSPSVAGRIEEDLRAQEAERFTKAAKKAGQPDPAAGNDTLDDTLVRPDIGPQDPAPSWSRREEPPVSRREIRRLERALDEAASSEAP